eukprot:CAMPEP_0184295612 /NCGR_PEP_ID=MMETSP1049-20130417/6466_1 /TAXON_ID=77928 /ORGANISM="Proteomonas sulcata, Strain CCMP704" /LENGTH=50 /DNA_ID=CAMNT_0026604237 /DNA_START=329 /DNA_END=481 /DNA_ORIENTATION=-
MGLRLGDAGTPSGGGEVLRPEALSELCESLPGDAPRLLSDLLELAPIMVS